MSAYSIFQQPWWLEAVAPGSWGEVIIKKEGQIYARLPYVIKQKYGLKVMGMPQLTMHLGPWLRTLSGKYTNQISEEHKLMTELIENLPYFDMFQQSFHFSVKNWLPFLWKNFQQTTYYTYRIDDISDIKLVWEGFRENIRREIRKAENRFNLKVRTDLPVDAFIRLNIQTFERQGKKLPYPESLIRRLDTACTEHNARRMFIAEDKLGRHHAGVYIVWDEHSAYYLMGGSNPTLRSSGAVSLCMWEAIQFAATVTKSFDFEGSIIESIERFFRSFGARQTPYFHITKINSLPLRVYHDIRSWLRL